VLKESIAKRYSEALYSLATEQGLTARVSEELDGFVDLLAKQPEIDSFFLSPVVDRGEKVKLLCSALESRVHELTLNFLILLARKRRENLVTLVARQMHELIDRQAGRKVAAISTPMALERHQLDDLSQRLSAVYDATIIPETKVAPELLGGIVVQVGDRYVDASISGRLEELRRYLLESADTWTQTSPNGKAAENEH
jgi:F-type H+-transporting ATPase subunit delta